MVKWRTFINMTIMGMSWECKEKSIKRRKHEKISLCSLFLSHSFIIKS